MLLIPHHGRRAGVHPDHCRQVSRRSLPAPFIPPARQHRHRIGLPYPAVTHNQPHPKDIMRRSTLISGLLLLCFLLVPLRLGAQPMRGDLSGLLRSGAAIPLLTAAPVPPGAAFLTVNTSAFDATDPRAIREGVIDRFPLGAGTHPWCAPTSR
jgi:hypothetical protein